MYIGKDLHYNDDDGCNMVADMYYFGVGMHYNGCNNMVADMYFEEYYSEI